MEKPELMLEQAIRDKEDQIRDAKKAIQGCIATERQTKAQLEQEKNSALKELSTNKIVERSQVVLRMCKKYEEWALMKKLQQTEDITKQESFENYPSLPLKIS